MKAKEYMLQVQKLDTIIENKLAEVERWRDIATGTTAQSEGDRVQATGSKQRMADAVVQYVTIQAEINADIDRLADLKKEIIKTIESLSVDEYDILHKVYVQQMTLQETASMKDKSYSWVTTMHGRALANLQKILDERK